MRARGSWLGIALVVLASVSYGVQGIIAKYAYAGGAGVPALLAVRFGVASLVLWTLVPLLPRVKRPALRYGTPALVGFAALGALFVTNSGTYYTSLTLLPAGTAAVLVFVFPALVVLWGALWFGDRLSAPKLVALAAALLGVALTVEPWVAVAVGAALSLPGVLWALGSALSNSWYVVLAARFGRGASPLAVALYSFPVTALLFALYLPFAGPLGMSGGAWMACVGIGVLTGLAGYAYLAGVVRVGASRAAIIATAEPATTMLLGALLLGEAVTPAKLAGAAMIALAVALLSAPLGAGRTSAAAALRDGTIEPARSGR